MLGMLIAIFAITVAAAAAYTTLQSAHDARSRAHSQAEFSAHLAAGDLGQAITQARGSVTALTSNPAIAQAFGIGAEGCTLNFEHQGPFTQGHLDLIDQHGAEICSSQLPSRADAIYGDQPWLQAALRAPGLFGPLIDPVTEQQTVVVTAPISGYGLGAIFLDVTPVAAQLAHTFGGPDATAFLLTDASGRTVLSGATDTRGASRISAETTTQPFGWHLWAGLDRTSVLSSAESLRNHELAIIVVGLLACLIAAALVSRRLAVPVEQAERALAGRTREVEEQAALLDLAQDAILVTDPRGVILYWSKGAEHLYGWPAEDAIGVNASELLSTELPDELRAKRAAADPDVSWEGTLVQRTRDGRRIVVESTWVPRQGGDQPAIMETNRDITAKLADRAEQERLRAQAEYERLRSRRQEAQRLESLGQLAGGIAHDFNNLLAVILNYAVLLDEELATVRGAPGEHARGDAREIRRAAERAATLTRQLLAFARQEVVERHAIDVNAVVRDVDTLLRSTLGEHIEVHVALAQDLPPVLADTGQLEQVLVNLAVNARDAMPNGGELHIATATLTAEDGVHVELRVRDTGTGMPPEVMDRAFDPFFTTKPAGQGTGLGLATVYGIVKQSGGSINLESEPGAGTTVAIVLPVAPATPQDRQPSDEKTRAAGGSETILLVEDEPALLEAGRRILSRSGYRVLTAADGPAAIDLAAHEDRPIDLLLTDVLMPAMLGTELADQLSRETPGLRVLFMSGHASGGSVEIPEPDHVLEKPFTGSVLLDRVRAALDE
jgi:PAS domain S-box-containing protein